MSTPIERTRAKFLPFSIIMPIQRVVKTGDLFSMEMAGEILMVGRARIDPSKTDDLPAIFADNNWMSIDLTKVEYAGADLLLILNALPAAKVLRESLENHAKNSCIAIYNAQLTK